jgi:MFS family permease
VVFLIFRFVTGFCGAAFLSVAGGSVSDMFPNAMVGTCVFSSISTKPDVEIETLPRLAQWRYTLCHRFLVRSLDYFSAGGLELNSITLYRSLMAIISFVNQHVDWRWTYYALIIWAFLQAVALICVCLVEPCCGAVSEKISQFVPETYAPVILKWKAQRYVHQLLRCD